MAFSVKFVPAIAACLELKTRLLGIGMSECVTHALGTV